MALETYMEIKGGLELEEEGVWVEDQEALEDRVEWAVDLEVVKVVRGEEDFLKEEMEGVDLEDLEEIKVDFFDNVLYIKNLHIYKYIIFL